jgi:ABC-type transport system involved in Fe-S cluster assembly fused permease/ATPase subunit
VRDAEQILVLREGRMEALGKHEDLLARSSWYRETWERQRMSAELEHED